MNKIALSKKSSLIIAAVAISLFALDIFVWHADFFGKTFSVAHDYFLDVGQGDAELVLFPGDVKVMTDAGPTDAVVGDLEKVLPQGDDYIDLAIISHPQADHFNGYNFILDHYRVGAFIYNGRDDDPPNAMWSGLKKKINEKNIPFITLRGGDKIRCAASEIDLLSPDLAFDQSAELNDTGLVELIKTPEFRTLLTADTGANVEDWLIAQGVDVRADVLKAPHHGSKYSSDDAFLRAVNPSVAVIEVGAKNTYGQPASSTLARIASSTRAVIVRTDQNGTIEIYPENNKLKIVKQK